MRLDLLQGVPDARLEEAQGGLQSEWGIGRQLSPDHATDAYPVRGEVAAL